MNLRSDWRECTVGEPCPICEKTDWCAVAGPTGDAEVSFCMRVESDRPKSGGWLHFLRPEDTSPKDETKRSKGNRVSFPHAAAALASLERRYGKRSAHWVYHDQDGKPAGLVIRWNLADGKKDMRPVSRNGSGWFIGAMPDPRPLYRQAQVAEAERVILVEGERCVDALTSIGVVATTSSGGARAASKSSWSPLADKEILIWRDNDRDGLTYQRDVVAELAKLSPPPRIRTIRIDPAWPAKFDAADWVRDGGTHEELERMMCEAEPIEVATGETPLVYKPFPVDSLAAPVARFVKSASEAIGCDAALIALPALACCAAAIGNSRRVMLKRGWCEPSVLWCAVVGESGSQKSPALEAAVAPLTDRQSKAFEQYAQRMEAYNIQRQRYEQAQKKWNGSGDPPPKPETPVCERLLVSDVTLEGLVPILRENPRGVLMCRDELSAWLGSFDKYAAGKASSDAGAWLSMHDAREFCVDRKTGQQRTLHVPRAAVSVAGTIQPMILNRALGTEHRESGLAARMLLACPPRAAKCWSEREVPSAVAAEYEAALDRLLRFDMETDEGGRQSPGLVRLSPEARDLFIEFVNRHGQESVDLSEDLRAAFSKLEGAAARIALQNCLLAGEYEVSSMSMRNAISIVEWFKYETRRVYSMFAESDHERKIRGLAEWVQSQGGEVTARELVRGRWLIKNTSEAEEAIRGLVAAGYGQTLIVPPGPQGGRPKSIFRLHSSSTSTQPVKPRHSSDFVDVDEPAMQPAEAGGWSKV